MCQTFIFRDLLFLPLRCPYKTQTLIKRSGDFAKDNPRDLSMGKKQIVIAVRLDENYHKLHFRFGDAVQVWEPVYRDFLIDSLESFQAQVVPGMKVRDFPP